MRTIFLAFVVLITSPLFSHYPDGNRNGNLSLIHLESASTAIIDGCVNAITGEFYQSTNDLQIPGSESLFLERYLGEKLHFNYDEHSWHYFGLNVASKIYPSRNPVMRESNGAVIDMEHVHKHGDRSEYHLNRSHVDFGVTNFSGELLGRKNHLRFVKTFIDKKETHAVLEYPNGLQRVFEKNKKIGRDASLLPTRENRPSGAYVEYNYIPVYGISQVTLKARNGDTLSSIKFQYPDKKQLKDNPYFDAIGSNGQRVRYHLAHDKKSVHFNITKVEKWHAPNEHIKIVHNPKYNCVEKITVKHSQCRFREAHLYHYGLHNTRNGNLQINYNGVNAKNAEMFVGRVHKLRAPVGSDAHAVTTHEFIYWTPLFLDQETQVLRSGKGSTTVFDAHGHKTCYHWNDSYQLDKIEKFTGTDPYQLHSTEYFRYDRAGQLTQRYFDKAGEGVLFCRQFSYDQFGDLIEDQLWGNLTGKELHKTVHMSKGIPKPNGIDVYTKRLQYTQDRFHNISYESDGLNETRYEYLPDTDTLIAKFCGPVGKIEAREFYLYNARGELTCKICDDGSARDENNLQDVLCRKIERRKLENGLPVVIDDVFYDPATGQEALHSRHRIRYSTTGKPVEEQYFDANGEHLYTLIKEYDTHDNVILATDALGTVTRFAYDKNDNLILHDCEGIQKRHTYDFSNRLIKEELVGENTCQSQSHRYDYLSQKTASTDNWGNETTYLYDDFGRPIQENAPSYQGPDQSVISPITFRAYDSTGNITTLTTPSGYKIHSLYNVRGDLIHSWDQDGTLQRCEYAPNNLMVKKIERSGLETRYTYDFLGRVIREELFDQTGQFLRGTSCVYKGVLKLSETDSAGIETHYGYNFRGQCISKRTVDSHTVYSYDTQGRIIREQLDDIVKTTVYDHFNRPIEESSDGMVTKKTYDAHGRLIVEHVGEQRVEMVYNGLGLPISITDGENKTTVITYDDDFINSLGQKVRLITHTEPNGTRTETEYNSLGKVARQSTYSPMGELLQHSLSFYDYNGKLAETVATVISRNKSPYDRKVSFQYDPQGRLVCLRDAAGAPEQKTTLYFYNTLGQKISEKQPNDISLNYSYDVLGRLSAMHSTDDTVSYVYAYDTKDNVINVQDLVYGNDNVSFYDNLSQLTQETLGNGLTLKYGYDAVGRMTTMTLPDESVVSYSYKGSLLYSVSKGAFTHVYAARNLSGKSIEELLPFGEIKTTRFSKAGQKLEISTAGFCDSVTDRDISGNVLERSIQGKTQNYRWDLLHQLKEENGLNYVHDSIYNRTKIGNHDYSLNQLNQVLSDGTNTYAYDSNGNLIHGRDRTLEYDALNRLVAVNTKDGRVEYRYDSYNRRITTLAAETTHYFYFGMNELGAISPAKRELRVFGESEGGERGAGVLFELNGETFIPLYDLTGNVIQLRNALGEVVEEYNYDLSGVETNKNPKSPWRYSSKRVDSETGFVYFGFRYYDPLLGRWITADPRGYTAGPNLYTYVMNNPIAHMDQYGHISERSGYPDRGGGGGKAIRFGTKRLTFKGLRALFVSVPQVQEPLDSTKSKISSKLDKPYLLHESGRSQVFALYVNKEPDHHHYFIVFVNGMNNTLKEAYESALLISQAHNNMNVYILHNPTEGILKDLFSACGQMLGNYPDSCKNIEKGYSHLFKCFQSQACIAYAHSKGVLINSKVFKKLPKEVRRNIYSMNFGGAHIIKPKGLAGSANFISDRDAIPMITSPIEMISHAFAEKDYIEKLDGNGIYGLDHSFNNDTYQKALNKTAPNLASYLRSRHENN